jgi:hypothetical protein
LEKLGPEWSNATVLFIAAFAFTSSLIWSPWLYGITIPVMWQQSQTPWNKVKQFRWIGIVYKQTRQRIKRTGKDSVKKRW